MMSKEEREAYSARNLKEMARRFGEQQRSERAKREAKKLAERMLAEMEQRRQRRNAALYWYEKASAALRQAEENTETGE